VKKAKWKNLKIGTKYILAFSVSIVLFLVAGFVIFNQVQQVQNDIEALERRGDRSIDITEMGSLIRTKDIRVADYVNFESLLVRRLSVTKLVRFVRKQWTYLRILKGL